MLAIIDRICRAVALYFGGAMLALLLALIVVDVVGRYGFNAPLFGALDLYGVLLASVVASCIGYGGRTGAHVSADVFGQLIRPAVDRLISVATKLLAAAVMAVWSWQLFAKAGIAARLEETTQLLHIPFQPVYQVLGAGIGLYAVVLLLEAAVLARRGVVPLLADESHAMGSPE